MECIDFSIRATGAVPPEVQITTKGIGGATLLDLTKPHGTCSESAIPGSSVVTIAKAATTDHWLRLAVRERAFPELAQGAKGGLVFLATPDRPPLEVELTLRRQGFPAAFEAPLWFLGIGVPALLTAWVGFIFTRWQKDRETNQQYEGELAAFRKSEADKLRGFFGSHYHNIILVVEPGQADNMRKELFDRGIIKALPRNTAARVLVAINRADWNSPARRYFKWVNWPERLRR